MASYPTTTVSFPTRSDGQTISAAHINALQDEVTALESSIITGPFSPGGAVNVGGALGVAGSITTTGVYFERSRTASLGGSTVVPFLASDWACNGAMTIAIVAGNVILHRFYRVGELAFLYVYVSGATLGGTASNQISVKIPSGAGAAFGIAMPTWVTNAGTNYLGVAVLTGSQVFIYRDISGGGTNYALGTFGCSIIFPYPSSA